MHSHFDPDSARDDGVSSLPVDAQQMYDILSREGAHWRASAEPDIARIDQRLRERITTISATEAANQPTLQSLATVGATERGYDAASATRPTMRQTSRHPAVRRWATTLATIVVVAAFVAILSVNAARRPSGGSSHQTLTGAGSSTSAPTTGWVDLTQLNYTTTFSANDFPAVAPSNPQVVYETMARGLQEHQPAVLRATDDGGATWRTLATPLPASHIGYTSIAVSPINPQTVFLSLIDTTPADCPANRIESMGEGLGQLCRLEYTSVDGGASWRMTGLPLADGASPGLLTSLASQITSNGLIAQGQRLYAGFLCTSFACTRLVTSVDGGQTWTFADLPLLAHGAANVCDYTASTSGVDLYAVTTPTNCDFRQQVPLTLWHSVNAGATWTKVRQLATPNEKGMALTQDRATGATLLYMAGPATTSHSSDKMGNPLPVISQRPSDVKVSVDGGATWQSAPVQGIPSGHAAYLNMGLFGTLSDGSVVIDVIPPKTFDPTDSYGSSNFQGSDLYAWKPGAASWRLMGSVSQEIDGVLITHAQTGGGDTIYGFLTSRNDYNTFSIIKETVTP